MKTCIYGTSKQLNKKIKKMTWFFYFFHTSSMSKEPGDDLEYGHGLNKYLVGTRVRSHSTAASCDCSCLQAPLGPADQTATDMRQ